jgi:hypothetical protein
MAGVDAIINLCGVGIADRWWSDARKQLIKDSRLEPTEVLATAAAAHGIPTLLNASGINYYGPTGDREVDETAPSGTGFLAEVCREWEAAAQSAAPATRVVLLRTGGVLSRTGGLLAKLRPLFRAMLGGRIGNGEQYFPWISLDDEVDAITFLLEHPQVRGPVNLVGPQQVTNAEFTSALGRAVRRPTPFPVPAPVLRTMLGAMAEELVLTGPRAVPSVLLDAGYRFAQPTLDDALRAVVGGAR